MRRVKNPKQPHQTRGETMRKTQPKLKKEKVRENLTKNWIRKKRKKRKKGKLK